MKKVFLKISVMSVACLMLAASAWAQSSEAPGQQPNDSTANRGLSTKHLSATGRDGERCLRGTQLSGSVVNDSAGKQVATVEDTIINPASGRIDFALLSLNSAADSSNSPRNKLVPVPWSLLKTASGSAQYQSSTEKPTFTLNNVDQKKLNAAPTVSATDLGESEWQQRIYSYYGVTPGNSSVGGAESPAGEIKGEGVRKMENTTPERLQPMQQ